MADRYYIGLYLPVSEKWV